MRVPEDWIDRRYDLLVIGGGINGAAIARDAALRGLAVLLVEKEDWGWATSAKSSRLAHGGLRYLELMEFGLVHEALQDRERLLRQAPHLVRALRFLYPLYPDVVARHTVRVGLWLYDVLSYGRSVPGREFLDRGEALQACPALEDEGLAGAAVYYDASIHHVERLVIENVAQAHAHGAVVRNRTPVRRLWVEEGVCKGAFLHVDGQDVPVQAAATVNATGTWVDGLVEGLAPRPLVRKTKGIHVAVPRFADDGLLVRAIDGRTFFVLPWEDTCYIGTTDTDYEGDAADAAATPEDVEYLIESARRFLPNAPLDDVLYTWAGVRALVNEEGLTESNVTRRHILHDHGPEGAVGLWSLQGGKITTARSLAEDVVDHVAVHVVRQGAKGRNLRALRRHVTRDKPLPGAPREPWDDFRSQAVTLASKLSPPASAQHLVDTYGARWRDVLECDDRAEARRPLPGTMHLACEVTWAVRNEQATQLSDVMLRRTTIGLAPGGNMEAAAATARWMAGLLGWGLLERRRQLRRYRKDWQVFEVPGPATPKGGRGARLKRTGRKQTGPKRPGRDDEATSDLAPITA